MRTFLLVAVLAPLASGANLRYHGKPQLGARRCKPYKSLLEEQHILVPGGPAGSGLGKKGDTVADGYSRIACEHDIAPESQRISFKEHACGEKIKTCRLTELGMTPRLCFDFCRQYENAKFFGLVHGRDCYCSVYYHAHTTGGGECDAHCEGDDKEMCGGMEKSSIFEMHMCQDTASEADHALEMSQKAVEKSNGMVKEFTSYNAALQGIATSWKLGVCAVKPEGERACALNMQWTKMGNDMSTVASETGHMTDVLEQKTTALEDAQAKLKKDEGSSEAMSAVELATVEVTKAAAKVTGNVEVMEVKLKGVNPPEQKGKSTLDVYKALGDTENNWYAVCALVPVPGESYAMKVVLGNDEKMPEKTPPKKEELPPLDFLQADEDPNPSLRLCADRCIDLSTGTDACAAFNYQVKDGYGYCQMLTAKGVVEQEDAINAAVPIFEVSKTKRDAMGVSAMGCMAHGRFTAGHPKGPLGTKVIRSVTV